MRGLEFSLDGSRLLAGYGQYIIEIKGPFLKEMPTLPFALGAVVGQVSNADGDKLFPNIAIGVFEDEKLLVSVRTNEQGNYELMTPPGIYTVKPLPGQGVKFDIEKSLTIKAGEKAVANFNAQSIEVPKILSQSLDLYKSLKVIG